ncbi:MAG: DUF3846 domain-containing protein [Prevotella sp.]|nr:DUF3846 domain-containing protein [Candidatus Prevotella equi]
MAILYKMDGTTIEVHPRKGKTFSLTELQTYVGGDIQPILLRNKWWVCNEGGKVKGYPLNVQATFESKIVYHKDFFVGDILMCEPFEFPD